MKREIQNENFKLPIKHGNESIKFNCYFIKNE